MATGLNNGTRFFGGCRTLFDSLKSAAGASYSSAAATSRKSTASKPKANKPKGSAAATSQKPTASKPEAEVKGSADTSTESGAKKKYRYSPLTFTPTQVSSALGSFLGMTEASRAQAFKQIWSYIKLNNLQRSADKRVIHCDEKLKTIFEGRDTVGILEFGKLLSPHFAWITFKNSAANSKEPKST